MHLAACNMRLPVCVHGAERHKHGKQAQGRSRGDGARTSAVLWPQPSTMGRMGLGVILMMEGRGRQRKSKGGHRGYL